MLFGLQLIKSFRSRSQKFLDVGAGSGAKNFRCVEQSRRHGFFGGA